MSISTSGAENAMKAKQFLPNLNDETVAKMLSVIGANSIDDLFSDIPQ